MQNFTEQQELDFAQPSAELKVIEREEAKSLGLKRYFTGKPCKYGHVDERLTSSRTCITCIRERAKKEKHKRADYFKSYYKRQDYKDRKKMLVKKPENRLQINKRAREHYHENKEKMRMIALDKYYKMTDEQKEAMKKTRRIKRKYDKNTRIIDVMRGLVRRCLKLTGKKKSTSTEPLLGYTRVELINNLESKFENWMNWENHGILWEIDHVMPVSYCVKIGIKDPAIINQLDNLMPICKIENRTKKDTPPIGVNINGIRIYRGNND